MWLYWGQGNQNRRFSRKRQTNWKGCTSPNQTFPTSFFQWGGSGHEIDIADYIPFVEQCTFSDEKDAADPFGRQTCFLCLWNKLDHLMLVIPDSKSEGKFYSTVMAEDSQSFPTWLNVNQGYFCAKKEKVPLWYVIANPPFPLRLVDRSSLWADP